MKIYCGGETQQLGERKFAVLGSWVRFPPPPPNKENIEWCSPAHNVERHVLWMTSMRLLTLLRNSLRSAARSARIIGTQEYLQSMIQIAPVRGAKGHSGREKHPLNFGSILNLIISVVRCAEIIGYLEFQITGNQIWITSEMGNILGANRGIRALIKMYKNIFRIPENLNHYTEKDYRAAERKFLKLALEQRKTEMEEEFFEEWYLRLLQKIWPLWFSSLLPGGYC